MLSLIFYIIKDILKTRLYRGQNLLKALILPMLSICLIQQLSAQTSPQSSAIKPLQVGDVVPEALWNLPLKVVNHPKGKKEITLADYKDKKLIIIDFWATWCGPCIKSLDTLNVLQKEFETQIQIIPAASDPNEKISEKIKERGWSLSSLYNIDILKEYFPHIMVPHQVWIKNNQVFAIPSHLYSTKDNIAKVINNEQVWFNSKIDGKNLEEVIEDLLSDSTTLYQSVFKKRQNGQNVSISSGDNYLLCKNMSPSFLFKEAYRDLLNNSVKDPIIWDIDASTYNQVVGTEVIREVGQENEKRYQEWKDNYFFTYILKVNRNSNRKELLKIFREDLNRFFGNRNGIIGQIEFRKKKAIVFALDTKGARKNTGKDKINFYQFQGLLRKNFPELPIVVKDRRISDLAVLKDGTDTDNIAQLSELLLPSGIICKVEETDIPYLVIKSLTK